MIIQMATGPAVAAHRIVVFTGDPSFSVRRGIVEIDRSIAGVQWLIVHQKPTRTVRLLLRNQFRNLRKHGWRWIPSQVSEVAALLADRLRPERDSPEDTRPGSAYTLRSLLARANVEYLPTTDMHSEAAVTRVREFAPDLGLSIAAPILKPALFESCRLGTINLHKGKVPEYRGMPPAFWELWNDESSVGCTVHLVTRGLDKGDVIAEATVPRRRYSTVKGLQLELDEIGCRLMRDAAESLLRGNASPRAQSPGGKTYTKPTLAQAATMRRRLARALPAGPGMLRRVVKAAYQAVLLGLVRAGRGLGLGRYPVTVILYHRVSDDIRDSLTVGLEQFDRQMALLRRHCDIVSIEDVIAGRYPRRSRRPLVCVTFDDGYADNSSAAVPILLRHQVHAAFFVSTGLIGTNRSFPHDAGKVPMPLANMSWDDLRVMRQEGFTIGSHTVNHADCAKEPAQVVQRELAESLAALRERLGLSQVILAYPFGGRENMNSERLEMVRKAGYVGCLSAYGGFNHGDVDRFNVLRCGVNWEFSDLGFRCRIYGIR